MAEQSTPAQPIDAYKDFIDALVATSPLSARLIREKGIYTKAKTENAEKFNALVEQLSQKQRETLALMLIDEHVSAIHDVLVDLTWRIDCQDFAFTYRGQPVPVQLSGMGLHGDYVGRLQGWEWPEGEIED